MKDLIVKCCKHEQITLDQIKKYPMQVNTRVVYSGIIISFIITCYTDNYMLFAHFQSLLLIMRSWMLFNMWSSCYCGKIIILLLILKGRKREKYWKGNANRVRNVIYFIFFPQNGFRAWIFVVYFLLLIIKQKHCRTKVLPNPCK